MSQPDTAMATAAVSIPATPTATQVSSPASGSVPPSGQSAAAAAAARQRGERIYWRKDMTIAFLEYLREKRTQHNLDVKGVFLTSMMEEIMPKLEARWPAMPWSNRRLQDHYSKLKKKHSLFLSMIKRTGTSYDKETGLISASEDQWEAFRRDHKASDMWLRRHGLPREDLYADVFMNNTATGDTIVPPSDTAGFAVVDENLQETADNQQVSRKRTSRVLNDTAQEDRKFRKVSGQLVTVLSQLTTSVANGVGSHDAAAVAVIEEAIADARDVFSLTGPQLMEFMRGVSKPMVAVWWMNCRDDVEAKRALYNDIMGIKGPVEAADEAVVVEDDDDEGDEL
ncbi:hypothetical protein G7046_g8057 [Stylonectria norvegica]|nr:hypothetical protein G7046_g8057 [Stylonectria norvegica]